MNAIFTCLQIFQSVSFYSDELPFVKAFFFDSVLCHSKLTNSNWSWMKNVVKTVTFG